MRFTLLLLSLLACAWCAANEHNVNAVTFLKLVHDKEVDLPHLVKYYLSLGADELKLVPFLSIKSLREKLEDSKLPPIDHSKRQEFIEETNKAAKRYIHGWIEAQISEYERRFEEFLHDKSYSWFDMQNLFKSWQAFITHNGIEQEPERIRPLALKLFEIMQHKFKEEQQFQATIPKPATVPIQIDLTEEDSTRPTEKGDAVESFILQAKMRLKKNENVSDLLVKAEQLVLEFPRVELGSIVSKLKEADFLSRAQQALVAGENLGELIDEANDLLEKNQSIDVQEMLDDLNNKFDELNHMEDSELPPVTEKPAIFLDLDAKLRHAKNCKEVALRLHAKDHEHYKSDWVHHMKKKIE